VTDADDLLNSAAGLMVKVVCPRCDREVAVVRDSPYGPTLLLDRPSDESRTWMRLIKPWAKSYTVTEVPGHDPREARTRVLNPRGPGDLPHPNPRSVRRLEPEGRPAEDWTSDDLHCRKHGDMSIGRRELLSGVGRFRSLGQVVRVRATIRDD
jgi:hypothetical protein